MIKALLLQESLDRLWTGKQEGSTRPEPQDRPVGMAAAEAFCETGADAAAREERLLNYCRMKVPLGVVEADNGDIKFLLRR